MEYFVMLALAVQYIHSMKITHRDLKPENIIVEELQSGIAILKIGDFGISKVDLQKMKDKYTETLGKLTTPACIAPEVIKSMEQTNKVDIWALGIILYELVTSQNPFLRKDKFAMLKAIENDSPQPITTQGVS